MAAKLFHVCIYSDAELRAIEQQFPSCKVYLCDFHREQAWERWVRDRKHGLSVSDGDQLLSLLRNCAWASPARNGDVPPDKHYKEAEELLKESTVWRENHAVQAWLNAKWLPILEVSVSNTCTSIFCLILMIYTLISLLRKHQLFYMYIQL